MLLLAAVICLIAGFFIHNPPFPGNAPQIADFEKVLHKKEKTAIQELKSLKKESADKPIKDLFISRNYSGFYNDHGIAFLVYERDTLKFWSDNSPALEDYLPEVCIDQRIVKLRNGWFEVMHLSEGKKLFLALILIKHEFTYQNQYLLNFFQNDFYVPAETRLIVGEPGSTNQVKTSDGVTLFSLVFGKGNTTNRWSLFFSIFFYVTGSILIIYYLRFECDSFIASIGKYWALLTFVFIIILLRFLSILLRFPSALYDLPLFDPIHYGDADSFWLPSLGDLFINAILIFYLTYFASKRAFSGEGFQSFSPVVRTLIGAGLMLFLFWFSWIINGLFTGLIHNSDISFDINNLFSLDEYSYIAIFTVGLLFFSFFLAADKAIDVLVKFSLPLKNVMVIFTLTAIIHILISHFYGMFDLMAVMWALFILLPLAYAKSRRMEYSFSLVVFIVFLFSLYSVHTLVRHNEIKENDRRKLFASKLSTEQDPAAEILFTEISPRVQQDTSLRFFLEAGGKNTTAFEQRIRQEYFGDYLNRYDIKVTLFDTMCVPLIKSTTPGSDDINQFEETIQKHGQPTISENFYYIDNPSGKISYLGKIPLREKSPSHPVCEMLYVELESKFISEEIGFPELLLDRSVTMGDELTNYSYARYKNGQLINQFGKYPFSFVPAQFQNTREEYQFIRLNNFDHLVYKPNPQTIVILSKPIEGWLEITTIFSYLFAFLSLLILLVLLIKHILVAGFTFSNVSFKYRIQLLLVFIVLISLALFGGGTILYIKKQYESKNIQNISEKTQSVLIEIESKLGAEPKLDASYREYASMVLKKFSNVFFSDINLFDVNGNVLASSRPKVFDAGLASTKMNPVAFREISANKKTEFIHEENIGRLAYLSAYVPFRNKNDKTLAYVNLPYFAKQSELEKEISTFLIALINIYVFLFALSILLAIFISNYLTNPLKLIQEKISQVKLGRKNELIEWKQRDEIGSLVSEYNRMIVELSNSAELLAKSERESAWREMAKQVAHEIKNPLTPMKLSVQHLQRVMKDKSPDIEERIGRLTQTLIEQIDTLSAIASEFSTFAKMPRTIAEKVSLDNVIQSTVDLFRESTSAEIIYDGYEGESFVQADKDQLLRAFNNLLKNALQAIPDDKEGLVDIKLERRADSFLVRISDNGAGITEDQIQKIFVPNFTTKTGGMGLGLAMVKSIIENFSGKIWFETSQGKGTTFFVSLPSFKE